MSGRAGLAGALLAIASLGGMPPLTDMLPRERQPKLPDPGKAAKQAAKLARRAKRAGHQDTP